MSNTISDKSDFVYSVGPPRSSVLYTHEGSYALQSTSELPDRLYGDVACDLETWDPGIKSNGPGWAFNHGKVLGIAIHSDNFTKYIPVAHNNPGATVTTPEGSLDLETVVNWYKSVALRDAPRQIFANAQYDYGWLGNIGVDMQEAPHDVLVQAPVLNEHSFSYSLDSLGEEFMPALGAKKTSKLVELAKTMGIREKDVMANLHRFPVELVGEYAVQDVVMTRGLHRRLQPDIVREELLGTYELEAGLIPMLVAMRRRGVRVDYDRAEQLSEKYKLIEEECLSIIKHETGITVEKYFAAAQIAPIFDHYGISYPLTPSTKKPSIDSALLQNHSQFPAIGALGKLRKFNKARTTFVEGFVMEMSHNGRLHGSFNPLKSDEGGTISGRFSSSNPNLQQIPARDKEIGPAVRSCFIPEEGCLWGSLDYSQQEPRHCVSMAYRAGFPSAAVMRERFISDPKCDFHDENTRLTGLDVEYGFEQGRKKAKNIGLGLMYSMGGAKLCHSLNLPTEMKQMYGKMVEMPGAEGQRILDRFHNGAPYIRQLSRMCVNAAKQRGWIKTPMGRKFRFPMRGGEHFKSHKALNSLIQGMSADEMKNAMLTMYKEGYIPALTVHDEVDITNIDTPEGFRRPVEIMLESMNMPVPSRVDLEVGPSWGEIEKVDLPGLPIVYSER